MKKLYKYEGLIGELTCKGERVVDVKLYDITDLEKAPTRIKVYGGLSKYIYKIECTDAEERYLKSNYFYDSNLFLHRIEIPSTNPHIPAKVITQKDFLSEELSIFGPQEYIEERNPGPMYRDHVIAWNRYKLNY